MPKAAIAVILCIALILTVTLVWVGVLALTPKQARKLSIRLIEQLDASVNDRARRLILGVSR